MSLKKQIAVYFAVILTLTLLASCGSGNDTPPAITLAPEITGGSIVLPTASTTPAPDAGTTTPAASTTTLPAASITTLPIETTTLPATTTTVPSATTTKPTTPAVTSPVTHEIPECVLVKPEVTLFTHYDITPIIARDDVSSVYTKELFDIGSGDMILVNENHPIQSEANIRAHDLKKIYGERVRVDGSSLYGLRDAEMQATASTVAALNEMFTAYYQESGEDFLDLVMYSAYRSSEDQKALRDYWAPTYKEELSSYVLPEGCSDYQTGLGISFKVNIGGNIHELNAPQAKSALTWLQENAYRFGFIFRYPEGKTAYTGIEDDADAYHLRYVGKAHALFMQQYSLSLEEYLSFLHSYEYGEKHLILYFVGTQYEVFHVKSAGEITEIQLPYDAVVTTSGDNIDGYIVSIYRDLTITENPSSKPISKD